MTLIKNIAQHQVTGGFKEAAVEAIRAHTVVESTSDVGNPSFDVKNESELEQGIRNYIDVTSGHLVKLKTHVNAFVAINKLPPELLSSIILFADIPVGRAKHPYILYTWICRHWRLALIQNPNLWRLIRFESRDDRDRNPLVYELVKRSKSITLDIVIMPRFWFISTLEDFFTLTSYRIRRLWFSHCQEAVAPVLLDRKFPSLRGVEYSGEDGLVALLSASVTSDHLETFQCTLGRIDPSDGNFHDQLASIFSRIHNLHLTVSDHESIRYVLALLHNNVKILNLHLNKLFHHLDSINFPYPTYPTILPELQFLSTNNLPMLEHLRTPKLSSLYVCCSPLANTYPILQEFNFSRSKYLYAVTPEGDSMGSTFSILGFNFRPLTEIASLINSLEMECSEEYANPRLGDFLSIEFPREHFILKFYFKTIFLRTFLSILPRMSSLTEIYVLFDDWDVTLFEQIANHVPSVEKMVVRYGRRLLEHIRILNSLIYPRLKHLFYVTSSWNPCPDEDTGNLVGSLLVECLQSRHKVYGNTLEYISLEKCPPLPDTCIKELQRLGTKVVTLERDHLHHFSDEE